MGLVYLTGIEPLRVTDLTGIGPRWRQPHDCRRAREARSEPVGRPPTGSAGEAARGSFVSMVGRDEPVIREYIGSRKKPTRGWIKLGFWR